MKTQEYTVQRYDADEGKVFDWADLSTHVTVEKDPETGVETTVQEHLYSKTLFLGITDSIDNYVEVDAPTQEG